MKFVASGLSKGNVLFSDEIIIDTSAVTVRSPKFLGGDTKVFPIDQVTVSIRNPMTSPFCDITFHAQGDSVTVHGFSGSKAEQIQRLIKNKGNPGKGAEKTGEQLRIDREFDAMMERNRQQNSDPEVVKARIELEKQKSDQDHERRMKELEMQDKNVGTSNTLLSKLLELNVSTEAAQNIKNLEICLNALGASLNANSAATFIVSDYDKSIARLSNQISRTALEKAKSLTIALSDQKLSANFPSRQFEFIKERLCQTNIEFAKAEWKEQLEKANIKIDLSPGATNELLMRFLILLIPFCIICLTLSKTIRYRAAFSIAIVVFLIYPVYRILFRYVILPNRMNKEIKTIKDWWR